MLGSLSFCVPFPTQIYIVSNKDEYVRPTLSTLNDEQQDSEMSVVVVSDKLLTAKPFVEVLDSPVPESSPTITTTTVHQETFCPSSDKVKRVAIILRS